MEGTAHSVSLGGVVIYQSDSVVFERIARLVEREVVLLEQRQIIFDQLVAIFSSIYFLGVCLILFALAVYLCGARHGRSRPVQPRSPNPRPVLQRGGGTITRAGDPLA